MYAQLSEPNACRVCAALRLVVVCTIESDTAIESAHGQHPQPTFFMSSNGILEESASALAIREPIAALVRRTLDTCAQLVYQMRRPRTTL